VGEVNESGDVVGEVNESGDVVGEVNESDVVGEVNESGDVVGEVNESGDVVGEVPGDIEWEGRRSSCLQRRKLAESHDSNSLLTCIRRSRKE
jgi:hypothetical protein